jgi:hypothetical protein
LPFCFFAISLLNAQTRHPPGIDGGNLLKLTVAHKIKLAPDCLEFAVGDRQSFTV